MDPFGIAAVERTGNRSVRTKHATVSRLGAHDGPATATLIKIEAKIRWNEFSSSVAAVRAGNNGFHDRSTV